MLPEHPDPAPVLSFARRSSTRRWMRLVLRTLGSLVLGWVAIWGAVLLVGKGLIPLVDAQFHPDTDLLSAIRRCCIFVAATAGYWAYVHWYEKRDATELRLRPVPLMLGGASGALLIGLPMAALFALGSYQVVHFNGFHPSLLGAAGVIAIAAMLEELTFRCVLFQVIERSWGTSVALVVQAVVFALQHLENVAQGGVFDVVAMLVNVTLGGLLWAGVFIVTRNLWAATANHAAWNFTILLSGLPLSGIEDWQAIAPLESRYNGADWLTGGMFGPESSFVVIALTTIPTLWLLHHAWRRGAFRRPAGMDGKRYHETSVANR